MQNTFSPLHVWQNSLTREPLDGEIVNRWAFAIHLNLYAMIFEQLHVLEADALTAMVRTENIRGSVLFNRRFEGLGRRCGIHFGFIFEGAVQPDHLMLSCRGKFTGLKDDQTFLI